METTMSDVHTATSRMEDDVLQVVGLLKAAYKIAEAGVNSMGLDEDECDGLLRVVAETERYANQMKEKWHALFEMTKSPKNA